MKIGQDQQEPQFNCVTCGKPVWAKDARCIDCNVSVQKYGKYGIVGDAPGKDLDANLNEESNYKDINPNDPENRK